MDDLETALRSLQRGLDEIEARLAQIENGAAYRLTIADVVETRRRLVQKMRAEGLSVQRISRALQIPASTCWRDIGATGVEVATGQVIGTDGRRYAAHQPSR